MLGASRKSFIGALTGETDPYNVNPDRWRLHWPVLRKAPTLYAFTKWPIWSKPEQCGRLL